MAEIAKRYDVKTARVCAINENANGYVARATATLSKGGTAKINCLTNAHGGVKDITVEER